MIDLSKGKQSLYKIKLEDGTILQIKKPSQDLLLKMVDLQEIAQTENIIDLFDALIEIITIAFNRNVIGKTFTQNDISEMLDVETAMAIIQDYLTFAFGELGK